MPYMVGGQVVSDEQYESMMRTMMAQPGAAAPLQGVTLPPGYTEMGPNIGALGSNYNPGAGMTGPVDSASPGNYDNTSDGLPWEESIDNPENVTIQNPNSSGGGQVGTGTNAEVSLGGSGQTTVSGQASPGVGTASGGMAGGDVTMGGGGGPPAGFVADGAGGFRNPATGETWSPGSGFATADGTPIEAPSMGQPTSTGGSPSGVPSGGQTVSGGSTQQTVQQGTQSPAAGSRAETEAQQLIRLRAEAEAKQRQQQLEQNRQGNGAGFVNDFFANAPNVATQGGYNGGFTSGYGAPIYPGMGGGDLLPGGGGGGASTGAAGTGTGAPATDAHGNPVAAPGDAFLKSVYDNFQHAMDSANQANEQRYGQILQGYEGTTAQQDSRLNDALGKMAGREGAFDEAAADLAGGYENRLNQAIGGFGDVKMGYEGLGNKVQGRLENLGQTERTDIQQKYNALRGKHEHDLINRGLGNTTVRTSALRGVDLDEQRALTALDESLAREKNAADVQIGLPSLQSQQQTVGQTADISGQGLQAGERLAGTAADLAGQTANTMQRNNQAQTGLSTDMLNFMERRNDVAPSYEQLANLALGVGQAGLVQNLPALPSPGPVNVNLPTPNTPAFNPPATTQQPSQSGMYPMMGGAPMPATQQPPQKPQNPYQYPSMYQAF